MDAAVLEQFAGRWELAREVRDHLTGQTLAFAGRAELRADGEGLRYREEGVWQDGPMAGLTGSRIYLWRAGAGGIEVLHEDGRPFHHFLPGDGAEASHHCPPDRYDVRYGLDLPGGWSATWRVTGPRKDYISITRYARRPS